MFLNWWVATQKRVTKPFCVGRGVCSQWNDINNKTRNSKCFFFILMRDFYFRTRAWKLLTGMSDALKSRDCREFLRGSNVNREMLKINKCQNFGYITIKKKSFFFFFKKYLWSLCLHLFDQILNYILCNSDLLSILEICDTFFRILWLIQIYYKNLFKI